MLLLAHGQAAILLRRRGTLSMNFLKLFRNGFLTLGVWNFYQVSTECQNSFKKYTKLWIIRQCLKRKSHLHYSYE